MAYGCTKFQVRFVNHGYSADEWFDTAQEALAYAKRTGFECAIDLPDYGCIAGYSPLYGLRVHHKAFDALYRIDPDHAAP